METLPIKVEKDSLYVAMTDPMDMEAIEELEKVTGLRVVPMVAPQSSIRDCLHQRYTGFEEQVENMEDVTAGFGEVIKEVEELQTLGPAFEKLREQMDRIERKLDRIISILGSSPD